MASKAFKGLEELMCAVKSGLYEPGTVLMMVFKVFSKTLYFRNHIYVSCQIRATPPLLRDVTRDNMAAKYEGLKSTPLNKKHR